jgi:FG-GAP-like repeat
VRPGVRIHRLRLTLVIVFAGCACLALRPGSVVFTDITRQAGISFTNFSSPDKRYIVESMGGGVAFFDFDGDRNLDIYLLNSNTVEAAQAGKPRPKAALYRGQGNGTFEEVSPRAGIDDPGWAMGLTIGDYDNDGFDDLYVACFGPNRLYRNLGNGTFQDVTGRARVGDERFSTGAAWGDYDRDGDLDVVLNDLDGPPMLLRNDGGSRAGNWIRLTLQGTNSNRNARLARGSG